MARFISIHWRLAILWALSLVTTAVLTSAQTAAPLGLPDGLITEAPTIVSGPDLGFRIDRTQNGIALGNLVVRIDGRWVDTGSPATVVPVLQK